MEENVHIAAKAHTIRNRIFMFYILSSLYYFYFIKKKSVNFTRPSHVSLSKGEKKNSENTITGRSRRFRSIW